MTETLEVTQGQGEALPETTVVEQSPTVEIEQPKETTDKPRDETGKFTKKNALDDAVNKAIESAQKAETTAPEAQAQAAPAAEELKPADHWPAEFKDGFNKLKDPESKKLYLDAIKNVEAAHTKRSQEFAGRVKYGEIIEQRAKGATPEQVAGFIDYHMTLEQGFQKNPIKTIEFLAQQAGIDLRKQYGGQTAETDEFQDPYEQQLKTITQKVDEKLSAYDKMMKEQAVSKAQAEINAELAKTDASGNPLYAHFQKLEPLMVELKNTAIGRNLSFSELYQKALKLDPELSQQFEQEQQAKMKADLEAARKADLERAKKASTNLNGSAPVRTSTRGKSIDEAFQMARQQTGY